VPAKTGSRLNLVNRYLLLGNAMNIISTTILAVSALTNLQNILQRSTSQNGQPVEFGQPLFVIG
jgi:hypothetical protein